MPVGGPAFSSVRKAREALRERAHELLNEYINICKQAAAAGDYETAQKGFSDILKHLPKDDDGSTVFEQDVDRKVEPVKETKTGPSIQIGVAIGGLTKSLPAAQPVVVEVLETDDHSSEL